ncbi:MAG: DUF2796 domain-containing protein [Pseudomonadota bacterium]|nr:DUF2796 domain-containing protein [Pseudomonadota bacterium]
MPTRPAALAALSAVPALLLLALAPAGAEGRRELGAHVHGHGQLDLAREGNRLSLALRAPGADIVGCAPAAAAEADRRAVETALALLADPLALLALPAAAGCAATSAEAELETGGDHDHDDDHDHDGSHGEAHSHGDDDDHDADHAEHHDDDDHDAHDHDAEPAGGHSELHARWELVCEDADAIDSIGFPYFAKFPGAQELAVQVVSDRGARVFEVERDAPALALDGGL